MDGSGAVITPTPPVANGASEGHHAHPPLDFSQLLGALEAIYSPQSSNETRKAASAYLEDAKRAPEAPTHGFALAIDRSQPPALRHYGLSMLEYAIKYSWEDFTSDQATALREYVVQLGQGVREDDPSYLRNKMGQLWTEAAKRSWPDDWANMDELMVQLWNSSIEQQGMVLYVLEALSEEVFNREDPIAGLRGNELGRACVEIFTPADVLATSLPSRDTSVVCRTGDEGWIKRLCDLLGWCLNNNYNGDERIRDCAVKVLRALRACMVWVMPMAISATQCIHHISRGLAVAAPPIQMASVEALYAIYSRHQLQDQEFVDIVCPMFRRETIQLLREVYDWTLSDMNPNDLDDQKYSLCKKLSELTSNLGAFLEQRPQLIPSESDLPGFFQLLYDMLRNPSLVVSIPILHIWTKLLRSRLIRDSATVSQMIGGLLEICSSRLVRYESLPEGSEDPTLLFLNEDIDTVPERHAFLGNYRRYCVEVIELVVRRTPVEAINHILSQAEILFRTLYDGQPPFQSRTFAKNAPTVLRVDAQITVIDATLKGYLKWVSAQGSSDPQQFERNRNDMQDSIEQWCTNMLQKQWEDPEIAKKVISLLITFATKALDTRPGFALKLLEYILNSSRPEDPSFLPYSESVKELERECTVQTQKLAMYFPNDLINVYDDIEHKISSVLSMPTSDDRLQMGFRALLFIIVHRSTTLDRDAQEMRLKELINPVKDAWNDPNYVNSVASFQSFCEMLDLGGLAEFFSAHNFSKIQDWSSQPLDDNGQAIQANIQKRSQLLPLRLTKSLLAASTERLKDGSQAYEMACTLWANVIPTILPNLLQIIRHAQAFNNLETWAHLPEDLQQVIRRLLTDRFWQAGISTESRDDFFARVNSSRATYEGFASTVRGTIRQIRESCYYILYAMTRFRDFFYGIPDLPVALSEALYGNARGLSSHHLSVLLNASNHLIENCPTHLRSHFLPPIISGLFRELDNKLTTEWDAISKKVTESGHDDDLSDEMKVESILRQLTYSAVSLVSVLLDFQRTETPQRDTDLPKEQQPQPMWSFILTTPAVLEPVLMFSNHVLRARDTRCCLLMTRVLRSTFPHFKSPSPVRTFICHDILQSAITSLHEPYFVDAQKDLAGLISNIIQLDEDIPRTVLLSLPGLASRPDKVDRRISNIRGAQSERVQRSLVLDLLSSVRGVSIHEQGRIERRAQPKQKSTIQAQYMSVDEKPVIVRGGSPELAGVAGMFG